MATVLASTRQMSSTKNNRFPATAAISAISPAVQFLGALQRVVASTMLYILLRLQTILSIVVRQVFYTVRHAWRTGKAVVRHAWKKTEKARDRVFFEFMVWILNPHAVALLVFWPGWIVIGGLWVWWMIWG